MEEDEVDAARYRQKREATRVEKLYSMVNGRVEPAKRHKFFA